MVDLNSLHLEILRPKSHLEQTKLNLFNTAYDYWKNFWGAVFASNGTNDKPNPDDFSRQDYVFYYYKENPAALHLYSIWNLDLKSFQEHSYFRNNELEPVVQYLCERNLKKVLSMEYLTIDVNWRKQKTTVPLIALMIGMGREMAKRLELDACVAPVRKDVKVTEFARIWGAKTIRSDVMLHNTPCDLMIINKSDFSTYPSDELKQLVRNFSAKSLDEKNLTAGYGTAA